VSGKVNLAGQALACLCMSLPRSTLSLSNGEPRHPSVSRENRPQSSLQHGRRDYPQPYNYFLLVSSSDPDRAGTAMPPWYQGRGLHEPPKSRSRSRFRINLQRPLDLSSERSRMPPGKFSGLWPFTPGDHRVRAQVRVICSAASSGGQERVVRHHYGVGIAVWAWSSSRCRRHGC
jgi:hypothetical protein